SGSRGRSPASAGFGQMGPRIAALVCLGLVVAGSPGTIARGTGCGASFSQPAGSPFPTEASPHCVTTGDFNLDGKLDLATANASGVINSVTILLGNGVGGFSEASGSPVNVGNTPVSVVVG